MKIINLRNNISIIKMHIIINKKRKNGFLKIKCENYQNKKQRKSKLNSDKCIKLSATIPLSLIKLKH